MGNAICYAADLHAWTQHPDQQDRPERPTRNMIGNMREDANLADALIYVAELEAGITDTAKPGMRTLSRNPNIGNVLMTLAERESGKDADAALELNGLNRWQNIARALDFSQQTLDGKKPTPPVIDTNEADSIPPVIAASGTMVGAAIGSLVGPAGTGVGALTGYMVSGAASAVVGLTNNSTANWNISDAIVEETIKLRTEVDALNATRPADQAYQPSWRGQGDRTITDFLVEAFTKTNRQYGVVGRDIGTIVGWEVLDALGEQRREVTKLRGRETEVSALDVSHLGDIATPTKGAAKE
jgi:hypothetical protein